MNHIVVVAISDNKNDQIRQYEVTIKNDRQLFEGNAFNKLHNCKLHDCSVDVNDELQNCGLRDRGIITFGAKYDDGRFPSSTNTILFNAEGSKDNRPNSNDAIYFNAEGSGENNKLILPFDGEIICKLLKKKINNFVPPFDGEICGNAVKISNNTITFCENNRKSKMITKGKSEVIIFTNRKSEVLILIQTERVKFVFFSMRKNLRF